MQLMLLEGDKLPPRLRPACERLIAESFGGGFNTLPSARCRALAVCGGGIIAHAAAQTREFRLRGRVHNGWILGQICVDRRYRRRGFGTRITRFLESGLRDPVAAFIALNCGAEIARFYHRMGYKLIARSAVYRRGGKIESDNDPVLAKQLAAFDVDTLAGESFFIGEDF